MTKQEIQALIDAKIAGQGTMVDVGGALPTILKEIVDMASAGANVQSDWNQSDNTKADFIKNKPTIPAATVLSLPNAYSTDTSIGQTGTFEDIAEEYGITADQVERLFNGDYLTVFLKISAGDNTMKVSVPLIATAFDSDGEPVNTVYRITFQGVTCTLTCANGGGTTSMSLQIGLDQA